MIGAMAERKTPCLLAALFPLMPQARVMGRQAKKALPHIPRFILAEAPEQGMITFHLVEMFPQGEDGVTLQICPPMTEVEICPPMAAVVIGPPMAEAVIGPPMAEADMGPPMAEVEMDLPMAEVVMGPLEILGFPKVPHNFGLPGVEIDTPVEEVGPVVAPVEVEIHRQGIMAPLLFKTLTTITSPP